MGAGIPLERGRQRGVLGRYFAVIGWYSVKTVADRYRHAAYALVINFLDLLTSTILNELEPSPPKKGF